LVIRNAAGAVVAMCGKPFATRESLHWVSKVNQVHSGLRGAHAFCSGAAPRAEAGGAARSIPLANGVYTTGRPSYSIHQGHNPFRVGSHGWHGFPG